MPIGCLQFRSCSSSVYCIRSTYDAEYKLICISITQKTYQPRQICHTDRRNNFHVFRFFGGVRVAHLFSFLFCVLFVFVLCLVCPMLPVSLYCPFVIAPSVFSSVFFSLYRNKNPVLSCEIALMVIK